MKFAARFLFMALGLITIMPEDAFAQTRRRAQPRRTNPQRNVTAPAPVVEAPAPVVNPIDSVAFLDSITRAGILPATLQSKRPQTTVVGNLVAEKTPLAYDNIRIDDQVYKQILWKDISVYEKMNHIFKYEGVEDEGNQAFFYILLKHIRDGDFAAFDATDDRFTTVLSLADVSKGMTGGSNSYEVPDIDADPDGTKGIMKTVTVMEEFDINSVVGYRIKEETIFDRETSRMHFRTLGIAPLKTRDIAGQKVMLPMFWVYYPEARPFLAKHEVYNPKNMAMRMSWEEIFESRYYAGTIYKSTINNNIDKPLAFTIRDPMHRLWEGENIKETIFNWEQDQWSY